MNRTKTLDSLLRKREALEREIAAAEAAEKRKGIVANWPEFAQILTLPDDVLRAALARIAAANAQPSN